MEKNISLEEYYKIYCPDYKHKTKLYNWLSKNNYKEQLKRDLYINSYKSEKTKFNTIFKKRFYENELFIYTDLSFQRNKFKSL